MHQNTSKQVSLSLQKNQIIWIALIGGVAALAFVVEALLLAEVGLAESTGAGLSLGTIRYVLIGVALLTAVGILVVRGLAVPERRRVPLQPLESQEAKQRSRRDFTIWIISMAMADSIAIYGLVLFIMSGQRLDFYLFAVPALLLMLMLRPANGVRRI